MDSIYRKMDSYDSAVNRSASTDDNDGDMFSVSPDIPGPDVISLFMAEIYECLQTIQDLAYVFEYPRAYPRVEHLNGGSLR